MTVKRTFLMKDLDMSEKMTISFAGSILSRTAVIEKLM